MRPKATQVELLAAILDGYPRRPIFALITNLYPIIFNEDGQIEGTVSTASIAPLTMIFEIPLVEGTISIDEITQVSVVVNANSTEKEITGTLTVDEITQVDILVSASSTELEITGTLTIDEITQVAVLVSGANTEKEITGTLSIDSITQV